MKSKNKGFIVPILLITIALLVIGGGMYIYNKNKSADTSVVTMATTTTTATTDQTAGNNSNTSTSGNNALTQNSGSTKIAVAGMTQYTDTNFGFSFWYPTDWPVQKTGNKIVVGANDNSNPGLTIQEFTSSNMSITDTAPAGPAGDGSLSLTYFFDPSTHTWMARRVDGSHNTTTVAADVSTNTIGGLHILGGNARFGDDVIVPLSAENFLLISSNVVGGGPSYELLVKTIVALDPKVATPVSQSQQIATIQVEAQTYKEMKGPVPTSPTSSTVISSISPQAAVGGTITIEGTGRGFYPGQSVRVIFNNSWLAGTITTTVLGNIYVPIPASMGTSCTGSGGICPDNMLKIQPGTYNVSVDAGDGQSNSVPLTVISL